MAVYKVGISTGMWGIGKDPALLGLATKIGGLGATGGINFVQIDLESIAEFREPEVIKRSKQMMQKLGIREVGLHGEISEIMSVDCAEKRIWDMTHDRLVQAVRYAADMGFFYVNIHWSARPIISIGGEAQQRVQGYFYPVVAPDGRGLQEWVRGNRATEQEAARHMDRTRTLASTAVWDRHLQKRIDEKLKNLPQLVEMEYQREIRGVPRPPTREEERALKAEIEQRIKNAIAQNTTRDAYDDPRFSVEVWLDLSDKDFEKYTLGDGEYGAFALIAHWMKEKEDYLWKTIAKDADPDELYYKDEQAYCAAIASKYVEGHLTVKNNKSNMYYLGGMSIKEWCEAKKLYLLFENPEANRGNEGANRLFDPRHYYYTIRNINSPYIRICLDLEHMVSHALDPDEIFPQLPGDFGKYIVLWHIGQAVPYGGTAHIPVARGSVAQEQIYKWMHMLRKKGWKNGYMLFERGGGRSGSGRSNYEVFEDSVLALKQIAEYLEKDIDPKKLPMEFFGITPENKGPWSRQIVTIREHAWDPLEGLLSVPEEKHTFFGKSAVDRGKAQEWEKRKFR